MASASGTTSLAGFALGGVAVGVIAAKAVGVGNELAVGLGLVTFMAFMGAQFALGVDSRSANKSKVDTRRQKKKNKKKNKAEPKPKPVPVSESEEEEEEEPESESEEEVVVTKKSKKNKKAKKAAVVESPAPSTKQTKAGKGKQAQASPQPAAKQAPAKQAPAAKAPAKQQAPAKVEAPTSKSAKKAAKAAAKAAAAQQPKQEIPPYDPNEAKFEMVKTSRKRKNKPVVESEAPKQPTERPVNVNVEIPVKAHGVIIGPQGATLQKIQTETGCTIQMPKRESGQKVIVITGPAEGAQRAKKALEDLANKGYSQITHAGMKSGEILIPTKAQGVVIGPQGSNLRMIQDATNTKINMPVKGDKSEKATIVGDRDGIKAAKAAIKSLIADGFSSLTHEDYVREEIDFPRDMLHLLIGPRGQTIKSIQGDTRARINISEVDRSVVVIGTPDSVARAKRQIMKLVEMAGAPEEPVTDGPWADDSDLEEASWD